MGAPLLAIPDGHQSPGPQWPHSPTATGTQSLTPPRSSTYLWQPTPSSHFPRHCENKTKTKARPSKDKVGCPKALIEKSLAFSQVTCLVTQQHSKKRPSPAQSFYSWKWRGNVPHWRNSTEETEFLKLFGLSSLKESDQQLLGMHFLNYVQKVVGSKSLLFKKEFTKWTPLL